MKSRGFTIVEILGVVAVIAILSGVIIGGMSAAKEKSRDAERYADLESVRLALRLYKETFGEYPPTGGNNDWQTVCTNGSVVGGPYTTSGSSGYIPDLAPDYILELPTDPSGCEDVGTYNGYIYTSDGSDYKLVTDGSAERGDLCKLNEKYADPNRTTSSVYTYCAIYTPGAATW